MSIVAKAIAQSDRAERFLSSAELTTIATFLQPRECAPSARLRELAENQQKKNLVDER